MLLYHHSLLPHLNQFGVNLCENNNQIQQEYRFYQLN
jgi:hypothetical protein